MFLTGRNIAILAGDATNGQSTATLFVADGMPRGSGSQVILEVPESVRAKHCVPAVNTRQRRLRMQGDE